MRDFTLAGYRVAVDVCGITYYVTDLDGNVDRAIERSFPFHKFGANRFAAANFPDCPVKIQLIEVEAA